MDLPPARIVFDITLEGSARKLVTIRSALLIINTLPQPVEVKLESRLPHDSLTHWVPSTSFMIETKATLAVPLMHAHSQINVRPTGGPHPYTFGMPALNWTQMPSNVDRVYELTTCHTHKGQHYRQVQYSKYVLPLWFKKSNIDCIKNVLSCHLVTVPFPDLQFCYIIKRFMSDNIKVFFLFA